MRYTYPRREYPIDDPTGPINTVTLYATRKYEVSWRQTQLYFFLIRHNKEILLSCAAKAKKLIQKEREKPGIDHVLVEQIDDIVDESSFDWIYIDSKPKIVIALRIFAGYWTPEYIVYVNKELTKFTTRKRPSR